MPESTIPHGNALIGQSGGPTMVINQSLVGVVEALRGKTGIQKILGSLHGVRGIVNDQFIELQSVPQDRLERIAATPSSALGSTRDKPDEAYCARILEHLTKHNVRFFFYVGGNDSSDTCRIVNDLAKKTSYDLRCFHVPKTIDNDLVHNDHTPGFGSAARFVACAFMGDNLDNKALPGVKINVIMGRHAGFLTAAAMLGRRNEDDGPHLVYVPEVPFDEERFVADVDRVMNRFGRCLISVSEGIDDGKPTDFYKHGMPIAVKLATEQGHNVERDAHGNVQLSGSGALGDFLAIHIKRRLGKKLRVRADTFGYMQRSFVGCTSSVDAEEARQVGRVAAELAMAGKLDGSVAIQRKSSEPYRVEYQRIELSEVAAKTRTLDRRYVNDEGNNINDTFKEYALPLVGPLPVVESLRLS